MAILFQLRHGTAAEWIAANPVLRDGEPGVESDTGQQKLGDGLTAWVDLPYAGNFAATLVTPTYVIPLDTLGAGKCASAAKTVDTNSTLTLGTGPVAGGVFEACYTGNGTNTLNFGVFANSAGNCNGNNYAFDITSGRQNLIGFYYDQFGNASAFGRQGSISGVSIPGQVTGLAAGTATTAAQPLLWTAVSTATSYLVEYRTTTGPGAWTPGGTTSGTTLTVSGLTQNTSYDYRCTASNSAGSGTASATVTSVTDSAGGGAQLTQTAPAIGSSLDLTTGGFTDYYWVRQSFGAELQKTGAPVFTQRTPLNCGFIADLATTNAPQLSVSDSVNAGNTTQYIGAYGPAADAQLYYPAAVGAWNVSWDIPIGTTAKTFRVHFGGRRSDTYSCIGRCTLTATLSDGSAGPLTISTAAPGADETTLLERHDIVAAAGIAGQTLTLKFEAFSGPTLGDFIAVQLIAQV